MSGAAWATLALVVASGVFLGLLAWCPGPLAGRRTRARADRALLRLARGEDRCPSGCTTCHTLDDRAKETHQ
ncbi:hypothetical protein [Streptomyces sp. Isolate_219]|uniref:hypothetical protein n=1 Tax=Streptomyces sp. Isolate_219 TaxID=2950110 RepID=UPI0021C97D53|nr:hypothetical protein [Streptomyces sp. Isolate_219]MCR8576178.1 hypothetical protein [Streptomyces sp. Isolate_219]